MDNLLHVSDLGVPSHKGGKDLEAQTDSVAMPKHVILDQCFSTLATLSWVFELQYIF